MPAAIYNQYLKLLESKMDNLVSVISPAHNNERHLENLIYCVYNQSIRVLEHIIIDDGSTDNTLQKLLTLQKKYPHIKVITQHNQGAGIARNKGILAARGKYIAFLDSDDIWFKDKLKSQIQFMEKNEISFSYGNYIEIDGETKKRLNVRKTPANLTYKNLLKSCPIGCLTVAFNQKKLGKLYMPPIKRGQDWALWLQICEQGEIAYRYPGTFASYTVIKGSLSKNKIKKTFDIYKIYRSQNLNSCQSLYYLLFFIFSKLRKSFFH